MHAENIRQFSKSFSWEILLREVERENEYQQKHFLCFERSSQYPNTPTYGDHRVVFALLHLSKFL